MSRNETGPAGPGNRWQLREVPLALDEDESCLADRVAGLLDVQPGRVKDLEVVRRGLDARKKGRIRWVLTVAFGLAGTEPVPAADALAGRLAPLAKPAVPPVTDCRGGHRALVVGMGPAGLFAALRLARSGCRVTLLDRGRPLEARVAAVRRFWSEGLLDPECNVQFGEGGAGTFSDGKLSSRVHHPWTRLVFETLVQCGAPESILVDAKPHVGTDRLRVVLINLRRRLQGLGVEMRYGARLTGLALGGGRVAAGILADGEELACDSLVLAIGHSARDTYRDLWEAGVAMESKPFAVGLRVEHPAALIDRIQYGSPVHPRLPAADYALAWNEPESGRGVYSFCMCPGGEVVIASSEPGGVVVNGMSARRRDGKWSNSALVVSVGPADFPGPGDPLAGVRFQRRWEAAAFAAGGGDYRAPAQNLLAFAGLGNGALRTSVRPGVREADLERVLPDFVCRGLRRALPHFDRKMRGFLTAEATVVGVETRTSAPVRILRDQSGQSLSHPGLFPAGEGAGYAGGITSAALDGLRTAESIVNRVNDRSIP